MKGEREVYENEEERVRGYLLGELAEDEGDRLERLLLADDDLFDLAEAIEADLLEAFDRGELPAAQRERVALRLASTAAGRRKRALARALADLGEDRSATVLPFRRRLVDPAHTEGRIAALAASVLLLVGGAWLASRTVHPGDGTRLAGRAPAIESPSLHLAVPSPTARPAASPEPSERIARAPRVLASVVALMTTRGDAEVSTLQLHGYDAVELRLPLEEGMEEYRSFRVALVSEGREVLARSLRPRMIRGVPTLVLSLSGQDLPSGRSTLSVSGVGASGKAEPLSFPELDVRR
jgi:hypothetical protein